MIFKKKAKSTDVEAVDTPADDVPPESLPLRELLPQAQVWPTREFGGRFAGQCWMCTRAPYPSGKIWPELPLANRYFLVGTGICTLWLAGRLTVPPLYAAGAAAVFPYTAAGKQATCLDNLRAIQAAIALYAQDHDGTLPPLDTNVSGRRATWVSLVRPQTVAKVFQCPTGTTVPPGAVASYVLNPVLALRSLAEPDDPSRTLLAADGGIRHDVSLLPPFPGWPSFKARPAGSSGSFAAAEANLGLRHRDGSRETAGAIFADGHAEPLGDGAPLAEASTWGGSLALRASLQRLEEQDPRSREFVARLRRTDVASAGGYYAANRQTLRPVATGMVALWKLNGKPDGSGQTSDSVHAIGWNLARALEAAGDGSARKQMDAETSRRMDAEIQASNAAGEDAVLSDQGFTVQVPRNWTKEEQQDGRYRRTYFRSGARDVFALFEVGQRATYSPDRTVDWGGMARNLRQKYGPKGYRLVRSGERTFYYRTASVWEYEVEKPGSPRLRKLYVGYVSGYGSHVAAFTAPTRDFEKWRPVFERMLGSFAYQ